MSTPPDHDALDAMAREERDAMTEDVHLDQTTEDEALGPVEAQEMHDPRVGEGTPKTAPDRPVTMSLVERIKLGLS